MDKVDWIQNLSATDEKFTISYKNRIEEGKLLKRLQYMFNGKLRRVRFRYVGSSIDAVDDRLPMAKAIKQDDGSYIVDVEVYGDVIDMRLRA